MIVIKSRTVPKPPRKKHTSKEFRPVFLVGVSHCNKGLYSQNYWFTTDAQTAENLKHNDWVLVDTCHGPATGRVTIDPIMVTREKDLMNLRIALKACGLLQPVISKIEYSRETELPDELPF